MQTNSSHVRSFRIILSLLVLGAISQSAPQSAAQTAPGEWTWMGQLKSVVYGTEYQFASANTPGLESYGVSWTDANGRLWMFGGWGADSGGDDYLSDLWVFDPSLGAHGEWAWMGGNNTGPSSPPYVTCPAVCGVYGTEYQFADGNWPGARENPGHWVDSSGRLWIYGGRGYDSTGYFTFLDDMWVFDPSLGAHGQWAWMGGTGTHPIDTTIYPTYGTDYEFNSTSYPGDRVQPLVWTDASGKFWLYGTSVAVAADLWVFDPSQGAHGEWEWMGGNKYPGGTIRGTVYGTKYQFAAGNTPGDRQFSSTWIGKDGELWLFGGKGFTTPTAGRFSYLNDLWVFDLAQGAHGEWAWMGGGNTAPFLQPGDPNPVPANSGVYGTKYAFAPGNIPGGRWEASAWMDTDGRFWLYGGYGASEYGGIADLDDLWVFDPSQGGHGEWAWTNGHAVLDVYPYQQGGHNPNLGPWPPVLGTQYEAASANSPGGLDSALGWADQNGNFWLFGGNAILPTTGAVQPGFWEYSPMSPQSIAFPALSTVTYGVAPITLSATASSGLPIAYKVNSGPGTISGSTLTVTGGGTYIVISASQAGNNQNYAAPSQSQKMFVYRAQLSIQADNKTMTHGSSVPALTWTPSGFVNGDTASVLTGAPQLTTTATSSSPPGTYPIVIKSGTLAAASYIWVLHNGTLTIH